MLFVRVEGQTYLREAQRVKTISLRGLACRFAERVAGRAIKALLSGQRRLAQIYHFYIARCLWLTTRLPVPLCGRFSEDPQRRVFREDFYGSITRQLFLAHICLYFHVVNLLKTPNDRLRTTELMLSWPPRV